MRRGVIAVATVAVVGLIGLVAVAATTSTTRAFTLGVLSTTPSPPIKARHTACQKPVVVPPGGAFDRVDFEIGTYHRLGPTVDVTVRPLEGALSVRHGVLPAGYPDVAIEQRQVVEVGLIPDGAVVQVCFHNRGPGDVALFGGADAAATHSTGHIDSSPIGFDYDLIFRREPRSFAELIPDIARRAALFRPPWVAPGVYYALFLLLTVGVPLLLARAVRSMDRSPLS